MHNSNMKTIIKKAAKLLGVLTAAFSIFMAFGWSFFEMMVHCKKQKKQMQRKRWFRLSHTKVNHPRYKFEKKYEEGKAWCMAQQMQDCFIKSDDGLMLHAHYLPAKDAKRFLLLSHGYKGSGFGDFAYMAKFLHEHNCNLLFIDQRCCGDSEGEFITFGAKEQQDIRRWAYYISWRNKNRLPIYLYGMSMGAASVLMASGGELPREVRGIISDCGFRSMKDQLRDMASIWFHLDWIELLLFRVNLFCSILGGFRMKDAEVEGAMKVNRRPILFFHGGKDTYVDPINSKYNYAVCRAPKELIIVPEARHLCCCYEARDLYRSKVLEFFEKYDS